MQQQTQIVAINFRLVYDSAGSPPAELLRRHQRRSVRPSSLTGPRPQLHPCQPALWTTRGGPQRASASDTAAAVVLPCPQRLPPLSRELFFFNPATRFPQSYTSWVRAGSSSRRSNSTEGGMCEPWWATMGCKIVARGGKWSSSSSSSRVSSQEETFEMSQCAHRPRSTLNHPRTTWVPLQPTSEPPRTSTRPTRTVMDKPGAHHLMGSYGENMLLYPQCLEPPGTIQN